MELVRVATLLLATVTMGLTAGVLMIFTTAIMPGLGGTDDRTFVGAFQSIDRVIVGPVFGFCFVGALAFSGLAALLHLPSEQRSVLPWTVAAFLLYLAAVVITGRVNIPLNNALRAAGEPDRIGDLAGVRRRFEARWVRWNLIRTLLNAPAFGLLCVALASHGQG